MNILMINTTDQGGGAAQVCFSLGDELTKRGHMVKYLVGYKFTNRPDVDEMYFPKVLPLNHLTNQLILYVRHLRSYLVSDDISFGDEAEIYKHPWYKQADVVHFHNRHGNFIKLSTIKNIDQEKKTFWTLHDIWAIAPKSAIIPENDIRKDNPSFYPPMRSIKNSVVAQKKSLLEKSNITFISPAKWLINASPLRLKSPIKHIPNGIRVVSTIRSEINRPLRALFIATDKNAHDKGIDDARRLAKKYAKQYEWHWLGTSKTDPDFITTPYIKNQSKLAKYLGNMDVLVYPSRADNFPLTIIQAMGAGLFVIAFDIGGIPELIKHKKNGYLANRENAHELENGLKYALSLDQTQWKTLRSNNLQAVSRNYSIKKMGDEYEKLYNNKLGQ